MNAAATKRGRVSFSTVVEFSQAGPLSFEELKDCWYSSSELVAFKTQLRRLAKGQEPCSVDERRGLEHITPQRQRHRLMTIRYTVSASKRGMTPDELYMVTRQCTRWNEQVAFVQGCRDFTSVYNPTMMSMIPSVGSTPPEFPFAIKVTKRSSDGISSANRSVRRRVSVSRLNQGRTFLKSRC